MDSSFSWLRASLLLLASPSLLSLLKKAADTAEAKGENAETVRQERLILV